MTTNLKSRADKIDLELTGIDKDRAKGAIVAEAMVKSLMLTVGPKNLFIGVKNSMKHGEIIEATEAQGTHPRVLTEEELGKVYDNLEEIITIMKVQDE